MREAIGRKLTMGAAVAVLVLGANVQNAAARDGGRRPAQQRHAIHPDVARRGAQQAGDGAGQRALASAVRPHQRQRLARRHLQRQALQHRHRPVAD